MTRIYIYIGIGIGIGICICIGIGIGIGIGTLQECILPLWGPPRERKNPCLKWV